MRSPRAILKHAEMYILRNTSLWYADPQSWSQTQEILLALRKLLSPKLDSTSTLAPNLSKKG